MSQHPPTPKFVFATLRPPPPPLTSVLLRSSGDEVVGATIKFDQLSKEEVMGVLKLMEPYDDRIQVLTRNNMSKSMGNLDQLAVSPEMVK